MNPLGEIAEIVSRTANLSRMIENSNRNTRATLQEVDAMTQIFVSVKARVNVAAPID